MDEERPNENSVDGVTMWEEGWQSTMALPDFMMYVDLAKRLGVEAELLNRDTPLSVIIPAETANALKEALMKTRVHKRVASINAIISCGCCECHKAK